MVQEELHPAVAQQALGVERNNHADSFNGGTSSLENRCCV